MKSTQCNILFCSNQNQNSFYIDYNFDSQYCWGNAAAAAPAAVFTLIAVAPVVAAIFCNYRKSSN
jgi:hypothetical protein